MLLLILTLSSGAAQLAAGLQEDRRTDVGVFGVFFHCMHSSVWIVMVAQQLLAPAAQLLGARNDGTIPVSRGCRATSVAASMLLMAASFSCVGCAVLARRTRHPPAVMPVLAATGLAMLCFSRAQFQALHDAGGSDVAATNRYGGLLLVLSSFLSFRIALRALKGRTPSIGVITGGRKYDG